jgi:MFS family permease
MAIRAHRRDEHSAAAQQMRVQGRRDAMIWLTAVIVFTGTWVAGAVLWARVPSPLMKRVGQGMLAGGLVAGSAAFASRFGKYQHYSSVRAYHAIMASMLAVAVLGLVCMVRPDDMIPALRLPSRIALVAGGTGVLLMAILRNSFEKYLVGDDYDSSTESRDGAAIGRPPEGADEVKGALSLDESDDL